VKVTANPAAVYAALDDGAVLLNTDSGVYFGLDPVGSRIWELVGGPGGVAEADIVHQLTTEYAVDVERLQADVHDFLTLLEARGLLERDEA
jgi:hypothetical protein